MAGVAALTLTGGALAAPTVADGQRRDGRSAVHQTYLLLAALENEDRATVEKLTSDNATLTLPMALSGNRDDAARFVGKDQVLGYIDQLFTGMSVVDFNQVRVTSSDSGRTTFVQANGDFVTADGRPYKNVYIFRYDWKDGRLQAAEEYANPTTFCQTLGHPTC
jgi:ketosteroid isomerase-like protein